MHPAPRSAKLLGLKVAYSSWIDVAIAFSELFANKLLFDSWQYDGVPTELPSSPSSRT